VNGFTAVRRSVTLAGRMGGPASLRPRRGRLALVLGLAVCAGPAADPDPQALYLPTGAVLAPNGEWLFVVNSNLDEVYSAATLVSIDVSAFAAALADEPAPRGSEPTDARPCRVGALGEREIVECDAGRFIVPGHTVELGSGAGNIAVDQPAGDEGPLRLLIPSSIAREVTWIDVVFSEDDDIAAVDCGQTLRRCGPDHVLRYLGNDAAGTRLPSDPGRIYVGTGPYRYAYLPHLLGGNLSLVNLSGPFGPELTDISAGFFDDGDDSVPYDGGFGVVERACDPAAAPSVTFDCARPILVSSYRFQPGVRTFTVRTGRDDIAPQRAYPLNDINRTEAGDRPQMGDVQFEDPETGERLLAVRTTPAALTVAGVTVDDVGELRVTPITNAELCRNPNILAVYRPPQGERIAFVSCYSDDEVAAVLLGSFSTVTIPVDDGPNDMVLDYQRKRLYVVHTLSHTVAVIELDRASPRYLEVIGRLGLLEE
jgi:hypothetical protein